MGQSDEPGISIIRNGDHICQAKARNKLGPEVWSHHVIQVQGATVYAKEIKSVSRRTSAVGLRPSDDVVSSKL